MNPQLLDLNPFGPHHPVGQQGTLLPGLLCLPASQPRGGQNKTQQARSIIPKTLGGALRGETHGTHMRFVFFSWVTM